MSGMHRHRMKKGERKRISLQRITQVAFTVFINGYAIGFAKGRIYTGDSKGICVPVLNCYSCPGALGACPIGSLQATLGAKKPHFPFYVLGMMMFFGILLGRAICGLLCPFGLLQDLLHKIPLPKMKIPRKADRGARYLKYLVLLLMVVLLPAVAAAKTGIALPFFCKYICPAGTLEGGIPLLIADEGLRSVAGRLFEWKLFLLAVIVVISMVVHRPFCRYLCPLGAFYALFQRFSFYQMELNRAKCVDCKKCERSCPMAVEVTKEINTPECIRCGKCKEVCPVGAITSGFVGKGKEEETRKI